MMFAYGWIGFWGLVAAVTCLFAWRGWFSSTRQYWFRAILPLCGLCIMIGLVKLLSDGPSPLPAAVPVKDPAPQTKVDEKPPASHSESEPLRGEESAYQFELVSNLYQPLKDGENIIPLYRKKRYRFQLPRNRYYTLTFSTKSSQGVLEWRFPMIGKAVVLHESGKSTLELGHFEGHRFFEIELTSDDLGMINIQVEKSG